MNKETLSRLMRLSWEIQRKKKSNRRKAMLAAWAIFLNEEITVYYLVKKHSHSAYPNKMKTSDLTLFGRS